MYRRQPFIYTELSCCAFHSLLCFPTCPTVRWCSRWKSGRWRCSPRCRLPPASRPRTPWSRPPARQTPEWKIRNPDSVDNPANDRKKLWNWVVSSGKNKNTFSIKEFRRQDSLRIAFFFLFLTKRWKWWSCKQYCLYCIDLAPRSKHNLFSIKV